MFNPENDKTGATVQTSADQFRQLIVLAQGGRLQRAAEEGRLFSIANQAKVATTAGLATTWTGLGISNLATTGKNLIIHEFGWGCEIAVDTAGALGLMTADTTGFAAALTIRSANDGVTSTSVAYADDGATIGTPILMRVVGSYGTGATTLFEASGPHIYKLDGGLIIPPGRAVMSYTTTATTATFVFYFLWEEVSAY